MTMHVLSAVSTLIDAPVKRNTLFYFSLELPFINWRMISAATQKPISIQYITY